MEIKKDIFLQIKIQLIWSKNKNIFPNVHRKRFMVMGMACAMSKGKGENFDCKRIT